MSEATKAVYPFTAVHFEKELPEYCFLRVARGTKDSCFTPPIVEEPRRLEPLSKVNIFVGENNSGKSRLMRHLARKPLRFTPQPDFVNSLNTIIRHVKDEMTDLLKGGIYNANQYFQNANKLKPIEDIVEDSVYTKQITEYLSQLCSASGTATDVTNWDGAIAGHVRRLGERRTEDLKALQFPDKVVFQRVYVPTLRGLRNLISDDDLYQKKTISDYFTDKWSQLTVFTGLSFFTAYRKMLLGSFAQREWIREFEEFIGNLFFQGRRITLIPAEESQSLEIKIGSEPQRRVSDLGDGIQSIILLTFSLFENKDKPLLIFYEEPELYLHPALQRQFLNVLTGPMFPQHQAFITTHSNHLLDITADKSQISIFKFRTHLPSHDASVKEKAATYSVENVSNDDEHTLELLGVRNSSVFLSNCTVWVEGITDRRYLAKFLRLFAESLGKDPFREDLHFSFVEYSGSNITHWSFLDGVPDPIKVEKLCGKLFLISDNDGAAAKSKKGQRFEALKLTLKERFYPLPVREIENLLPPVAIRGVLIAHGEDDASIPGFKQADYANEPIGNFINKILLKDMAKRKGGYAEESGTIKDKVKFCDESLQQITRFDQLENHAQELTRLLFQFISERNA